MLTKNRMQSFANLLKPEIYLIENSTKTTHEAVELKKAGLGFHQTLATLSCSLLDLVEVYSSANPANSSFDSGKKTAGLLQMKNQLFIVSN